MFFNNENMGIGFLQLKALFVTNNSNRGLIRNSKGVCFTGTFCFSGTQGHITEFVLVSKGHLGHIIKIFGTLCFSHAPNNNRGLVPRWFSNVRKGFLEI